MSEEVTLNLPVPLTEAEKTQMGQYLTGRIMRLKELEDQKKQEAMKIKTEMDAEQAEIDIVATAIYRGAQDRPVRCQVAYNVPEPGFMQVIRLDTMTLVAEREMTKKEIKRAAGSLQMDGE